uniref:Large ribosomal subunit protein bL28m n=1 Tax=Leptobrachium leishanense TaxID=445787 RepID=A0A8C5QQV6_9ANUR
MPLHKYPPAIWNTLKLKEGIYARLPDHYLRSLQDTTKPRPVHWKPHGQKYRLNPKSGQRERVEDVPVIPYFPPEADEGLWGGEGWISGYRYANNDKLSTRVKKTWKPQLLTRDLYSDILDKTFSVPVTMRTLDLIDKAYGFDFYILKVGIITHHPQTPTSQLIPCIFLLTPKVDLHSKFGMELKRAMLLRLASKDQSLYPDDPDKREKIYNKYKAFEIPKEVAEWVGLTLEEAVEKQRLLEKKDPAPPFKVFVDELVQEMAAQRLAKDTSVEAKS